MGLATSPGSHSTGPDPSPDALLNGDRMASLSPQSPEESGSQPPTPSPWSVTDYGSGGGQPNGQALAPTKMIPDVIVKDEATFSTTHFDAVPPVRSQVPQYAASQYNAPPYTYTGPAVVYYTDNSTHSTPFPVPSPSGGSTLNTPDTRVSDSTPSPLRVTPEARQGFSPNSGLSRSPRTPQVLACDQCNQKFDQPHKLKYVWMRKPSHCRSVLTLITVTTSDITIGHMCVSDRAVASGLAPRPISTATSTTSTSRQGGTTALSRHARTRDKGASPSRGRTTCDGTW